MKLRVLIVDDEAPARARLRQMLRQEPDVEIVGESANGQQALAAIKELQPDVAFLDIQMPRLNGLDLCRQLIGGPMPRVIFVTAFDQFALQAFEVHAIDYLLKPFDQERFRKALDHARRQLTGGASQGVNHQLLAALEHLQSGPARLERLAFKADGRVVFVRTSEIDWVEADGNYAKLHVGATTHQLRETMNTLESQLPGNQFIRISRSVILNLDRIKEVQPLFYGDQVVILHDGSQLNLSRNYRARLEALLLRQR